MRAGFLQMSNSSSRTLLHFGLGRRLGLDKHTTSTRDGRRLLIEAYHRIQTLFLTALSPSS